MKIEFSDHSIVQMVNRSRIKRSMVTKTIIEPDEVQVSYRQRTLYRKYFGADLLEVVTVTENGIIMVITQYFLETL